MLLGAGRRAGCEAVDLGVVRDDEAALEAVLRDAAETLRRHRHQRRREHGRLRRRQGRAARIADMRWMQIAIKPAKPFAFGVLAGGRPAGAGVRAARQPGQLARQLRAARPARRCAG